MIEPVWQYEVKDEKGNILLEGFGREIFLDQWNSMPHRPGERGIGYDWKVRWWRHYGATELIDTSER